MNYGILDLSDTMEDLQLYKLIQQFKTRYTIDYQIIHTTLITVSAGKYRNASQQKL